MNGDVIKLNNEVRNLVNTPVAGITTLTDDLVDLICDCDVITVKARFDVDVLAILRRVDWFLTKSVQLQHIVNKFCDVVFEERQCFSDPVEVKMIMGRVDELIENAHILESDMRRDITVLEEHMREGVPYVKSTVPGVAVEGLNDGFINQLKDNVLNVIGEVKMWIDDRAVLQHDLTGLMEYSLNGKGCE